MKPLEDAEQEFFFIAVQKSLVNPEYEGADNYLSAESLLNWPVLVNQTGKPVPGGGELERNTPSMEQLLEGLLDGLQPEAGIWR